MRSPGGPAMLAPRRATMGGSAPTGLWEGPETVRFRTQDGGHLTADAAGASAGNTALFNSVGTAAVPRDGVSIGGGFGLLVQTKPC